VVAGRLSGKVAFITGAARGQGRSHAVRLAEEGADIIATDLCDQVASVRYAMSTAADLTETVEAVEAVGGKIVTAQADVRDAAAMAAALAAGTDVFGGVDVVVANAGICDFSGAGGDISPEAWRDMIDINLLGVWNTIRPTLPSLRARGGGSVIIISSVLGLRGLGNMAHYAASKHGVVGLMRSLALQLGPANIRVNTIHSTNVNTPMLQNEAIHGLFVPDLENPGLDDFAKVARDAVVLPIPWVESVDISNAVVFLASEDARYITGVTLPVDAGALIK
jgi:SDR family mycofactocin-dependent oxidoreductase